MINLCIDLGNTDLTMCLYIDEVQQEIKRFPILNLNEEMIFSSLMKQLGDIKIDSIGISCVVPRLKDKVIEFCEGLCDKVLVLSPSLYDIKVQTKDKNELGADFIGVYYGVLSKLKAPLLVYDLGSASKLMFIKEDGSIEGVTIKPGIDKSFHNMIKDIPHLPAVELSVPELPVGHDTITAIQAGLLYGEIGWIKETSRQIESYYKVEVTKVITGGCSHYIYKELEGYHYLPDVILEGIYQLLMKEA